jgi:hypothetical protein
MKRLMNLPELESVTRTFDSDSGQPIGISGIAVFL